MSNEWKFQTFPELRERVFGAMNAVESKGQNVIAMPWAGQSGVSVGPVQVDLGQDPKLVDRLVAQGQKNGKIKDDATAARVSDLLKEKYAAEKTAIEEGVADRTKKLSTSDDESRRRQQQAGVDDVNELRHRAAEAREWAKKLVSTKEGAQEIEDAANKIIDGNIAKLKKICANAAPSAREFCNSEQGQIELVGFFHQNGNVHDEKIKELLRGKTVIIGDPAKSKQVRIERTMDVEQFREKIRDNTKYGRNPKNKDSVQNRDRNMDTFYRSNNIDDGSKAKLNPPAPPPPIPVPRDTVPKPDAAQPDKHSALPEDEADTPVQSAEAAPANVDENRFIVGWTTQPDMTSRPIWGNEAQYDAYKAQQAEAEAGVPAANDVAPTQSASLQQPAPEQNTNLLATAAPYLPDERSSRGPKVWNPDSGALADAVMQAGGTGLPIWTQMLLGRDAMTNGSRTAVKGLQNSINAATKPPGFDYHWGLGGRTGRIDVDGDLGPQTMAGFGRAVDKHGDKGFARIYALDQFGRYTKGLDTGTLRIGDLEDTLASTLGQVTPDATERAQETLNIARDMVGERNRYAPLKIDGWAGPVTGDAFKRAESVIRWE